MNPQNQDVGVDRDYSRRPGAPRFREPEPWPNSRWPIPRQQGKPSVMAYGREPTPVFSTAMPPRGVAGMVRKLAYRIPDHRPNHWLMLMAADRVDFWGRRLPRLLAIAGPLAVAAIAWRGSPAFRWQARWALARRVPKLAGRMAVCAFR